MIQDAMLVPLLSEADPEVQAEGSINPLGTYAIADALATRLVPGVRERQWHPRFLTAMAVSLAVCSEFDDDTVAADGESEPWQVFEWYVVEGLVRRLKDTSERRGLPGLRKAESALRDGVPLSAKRYLKSARNFGFHGVYRVLSRELGIEVADRLGEVGYELLETWAGEQDLQGFYDSSREPGAQWRRRLADAVQDGLESGCISRSAGWSGWEFFADHLAHQRPGTREAMVIRKALLAGEDGYRRPVLEFLTSSEGQAITAHVAADERISEREFHKRLCTVSDVALRDLIEAIQNYEAFSRLLLDAFDDCLYEMSVSKRRVTAKQLAQVQSVNPAAEGIPGLFEDVIDRLTPFGQAQRFQEVFADISERGSGEEWVTRLLEHHHCVQRQKPPNGRASWFERFDDGSYIIRPAYATEEGGLHEDEYVHGYRTTPLLSFATDLRMV